MNFLFLLDANISPRQHPKVKKFEDKFKYLDHINIAELREHEKDYVITQRLDENKKPLDKLIEDSRYMLNEVLPTVMDDLESDLDLEIESLLEEITDLHHASEDKETELASQRGELILILLYKALFKLFEGYCVAVGSLQSPGAETAPVSTKLSIIAKAFTGTKPNDRNKYLENQAEKEKRILEDQKTYVDEYLGSAFGLARQQIELVWDSTKQIRESSEMSTNSKLKSMVEIYASKEEELRNLISEKNGTKESTSEYIEALAVAEHLKNSSDMSYTVGEVYKRFENNTEKMNEINIALHNTRLSLEKLKIFQEDIESKTQRMLQNKIPWIENIFYFYTSKVSEWLIQVNHTKYLGKMKHNLEAMTKELNAGDELMWTFGNIKDALEIITTLNDKIENYDDLEKSYPEFRFVKNENLLIPDSHLRYFLIRLNMISKYNSVSDQYDDWILAFKQYSFPNAGVVLKKLISLDGSHKSRNIKSVIGDIKANIQKLKQLMISGGDKFETNESYKVTDIFMGSRSSSGKAFYTWTNEQYNQQIGKVLEGRRVKFVAKVYDGENLDALKFTKVGIRLVSRNPESQAELDKILLDFKVDLTHMGDSMYKCKEEVFRIQNAPTDLAFGFKENQDGVPIYSSVHYDNILKGEFMLSPYATWWVQLRTEKNEKKMLLSKFKDQVDMELVGKGQYLSESKLKCGEDMDKYYTKVNIYDYLREYNTEFQ